MIDTANTNSHGRMLPLDFVPSRYSVIIGRAKECKQASGNKRLRILATSYLSEYSSAINRCVKSRVVSDIVALVRAACPDGSFIKKVGKEQDGTTGWMEVSESAAREKVGYVFRDLLSDQYRSSSKSKSLNRLKRQREREAEEGDASSVSSSRSANAALGPTPITTASSSAWLSADTSDPALRNIKSTLDYAPMSLSLMFGDQVEAISTSSDEKVPPQFELGVSARSLRNSLGAMLSNAAAFQLNQIGNSVPSTSFHLDQIGNNVPSTSFHLNQIGNNGPSTTSFDPTPMLEPTPLLEQFPVMHIPAVRRKSDFQWMDTLANTLTHGV